LDYDTERFEPPAPVITINLQNPWKPELKESWYALLDTGSDISAIPNQFLQKLQLIPYTTTEIQSATHNRRQPEYRPKVLLDLEFPDFGISFTKIPVVVLSIDEALIGRELLNGLDVNLQGPKNSFDIK